MKIELNKLEEGMIGLGDVIVTECDTYLVIQHYSYFELVSLKTNEVYLRNEYITDIDEIVSKLINVYREPVVRVIKSDDLALSEI